MDSIPGQVEFRFTLSGDRHPDPGLVDSGNPKVLADIEGLLVISIDGNVLFEENGILLLELGLDMLEWVRDMKAGHIRDFEYVSIDYAQGALLRFVQDVNQLWSLRSPWSTTTDNVSLAGEALMSAVEDYLQDLATQLRDRYRIEITKYLG